MKKIVVLLLALCMIFMLCACGEEAVQEVVSDSAEAESISTVEDGVLHMATNAQFPPYEMVKDGGGFEGIDVEIATAIAEELGLELVVDDMDFPAVITSVQSGKSDIGVAGLSVNEELMKSVDFTETYAHGVQVIIVPEDSEISSVDDLKDKMIGTQEGTTGNVLCSDDYGDENVVAYTNGALAIEALKGGKVDCVVIDEQPAKEFVKANEGLTILSTKYVTEDYAIAVSKDNAALRDAINEALVDLIEDGTVDEIIAKYIKAD